MTLSVNRITLCPLIFVLLALFLLPGSGASLNNSKQIKDNYVIKKRQPAQKNFDVKIPVTIDISHVVVKFKDDYQVRLSNDKLYSKQGLSVKDANDRLNFHLRNNTRRLFNNQSEQTFDRRKEILQVQTGQEMADLNSYFRINISDPTEAEQLINDLNRLEYVEIAYFEPMPEPAGDLDPPTPDYQASQDYREAAPAGVDADYANTLPGGDGSGVKIVDIEGGWRDTHEDLDKALGGLIAGVMIDDISWRNHGTAVLGEMIAGDNGYGITGICPGADAGMVSIGTLSTAEALVTATDNLQPGDLILIELHAPGPHYDFQSRPDQLGYVCMEYWQANFDAIVYAWANGVVVIEAGGNGSENFDDFNLYGQLFDTTYRNSHAIIVGAGYPASSSSNLQKHGFSNYGERVNLQGYGSGVYTTGYGGLFAGYGGDEDQYYTSSFSGTSSASPIVTGAAACLQGYYKANFGGLLNSDQIRTALVLTGTPQLGDLSKHIGPRPNLAGAIATLTSPAALSTNPIFLDTTLDEGQTAIKELWIRNGSSSESFDFNIIGNDSAANKVGDWLQTYPISGTVPPSDSVLIDVTFDAAVIVNRLDSYKGALEIYWGVSGGSLDSLKTVLVYLTVPCYDTTYSVKNSNDPGGPEYNWFSAKDNGFKVPNNSFYNSAGANPLDDGSAGSFTMGFNFNYFGIEYNQFYVGVNGAISFTDSDVNSNGYFSGFSVPGAPFNTFLPAFWNDLIIDDVLVPSSGVYIWKKTDTVIVEWYKIANFNIFGDTTTNFEIILTKDRSILYQYKDIGISGLESSALIGLDGIECEHKKYFDNGDIPSNEVSNGIAVKFTSNMGVWMWSGDFNQNGLIDISDLTFYVDYMFNGGPAPSPLQMADVNCDGSISISDITFIVEYMFSGGGTPCSFWYAQ